MDTIPGAIAKRAKSIGQKSSEFLFGEVGMSHRFTVSIDKSDYDLGTWAKVSGLSVTWGMCEYRGGEDNVLWTALGIPSYQKIKMSRAACSDSATVKNWLVATVQAGQPLTGSIKMLDWTGSTLIDWELSKFFPSGWSISDFNAGNAGQAAIETLEISHTGFIADEWTYPNV
jgi:phage tail-like protein